MRLIQNIFRFRFLFKLSIDTVCLQMHLASDQRGCLVHAGLIPFSMCVCRFTSCLSFYSILNELNDYAGQREVVAEEMAHKVYGELMRYSQDLKAERKHVSTHISSDFKVLSLLSRFSANLLPPAKKRMLLSPSVSCVTRVHFLISVWLFSRW